jgi:hypothetical protein
MRGATARSTPIWRVGTYKKLYVYDQNLAQNDVTPYRSTGTLRQQPADDHDRLQRHHGPPRRARLLVGDVIYIAGATAVGGITPNMSAASRRHRHRRRHYTYLFTSNATSTATGGGAAVTYKYEIPIGVELGTYGYGWGVGGWGLGTWGTAHSLSTIYIEPRIWSLDHFGTLLLATYNGGTLYQFDPTQAQPWPRATLASPIPACRPTCAPCSSRRSASCWRCATACR